MSDVLCCAADDCRNEARYFVNGRKLPTYCGVCDILKNDGCGLLAHERRSQHLIEDCSGGDAPRHRRSSTMISVFLSCPVRPVGDETKEFNLDRALEYYRVLSIALPSHTFIMPWWVNCKVFPETPEQIAIGMMRNKYWIRRCDQLWWCGPRVSGGMRVEGNYMDNHTHVDCVRRVIMNQAAHVGTGQLIIGTLDVHVSRTDAELFRADRAQMEELRG